MKAKFYTFFQNNSGGGFDFDESGITRTVCIEAHSADEANERAVKIGIYFDGCDTGQDCHCCGDRWSAHYDDNDGKDEPMYYNEILKGSKVSISWMGANPESVIHYLNGTVEWLDSEGQVTELKR